MLQKSDFTEEKKKKKSIKILKFLFFWGGGYVLCEFFKMRTFVQLFYFAFKYYKNAFLTECAFSINMKFTQPEYPPLHKTRHLILYLGLQFLSSSHFLQCLIHQDFVVRQASLIDKEFIPLNMGTTLKVKTSLWHQISFAYFMSSKKITI